MGRDVRKLYRFAFYGRSGSGKSCYLGMLALSANGERGLTCERLPVEVPKPDVSKDQFTFAEREALGLHEGKEWLDRIIGRLGNGELPEPNPPAFDRALPTLDFRVGEPSRGTSIVRLVDYSGELINPALEDDPESFVRKLRAFLAESDGFLVFAEVPRRNDPTGGSVSPDLLRLREAFASLQESKADTITTPVCVVLTKWDRESTIDWDNPGAELEKLERFLDEHSEYEGLINSVQNALARQAPRLAEDEGGRGRASLAEPADGPADFVPMPDQGSASAQPAGLSSATPGETPIPRWGLSLGNTCVFPVSSFGSARRDDARELPPTPPRPFGLVEPLVWLAERRDVLDVADLEQRWKRCRWQWLPFAFLVPAGRAIRRDAARLSSRIPSHTQSGCRLAQIRRKARQFVFFSLLASFLATVILVLVPLAGGTSHYRNYQFRTHASMAGDPTLTLERIDGLKQFFERYIAWGWWNGPLAPNVDEAKQQIDQLNQRVDELLWAPVQSASDLAAKATGASEYLKRLPNGKHAPEASSIAQQWEAEKAKGGAAENNRRWLDGCASQLARAKSVEHIDGLIQQLNQGFPEPNYVTPDQSAKRDELQAHANKRRGELAWADFVERYRQELAQGNLRAAAEVLVKHAPRDAQWRGLAEEFPKEVEAFLENKMPPTLKDARFSDGRNFLNQAVDALKHVESALRPDDAALADAMLKVLQEAGTGWGAKIDEREDRTLYESVRTNKDKRACDRYLHDAPLKVMKRQVEAYKAYLEELDGELECEVELKVLWHKDYKPDMFYEGENYITVTVDHQVVWKSKQSVAEDPGKISGQICTFPLKGRREKSFDIGVWIEEADIRYDDDGGSGEGKYTLERLARGEEIPLRPAEGGFTNKAVLSIVKGWPEEPSLPVWDKGI